MTSYNVFIQFIPSVEATPTRTRSQAVDNDYLHPDRHIQSTHY